jgi:DNA-binding CsgD family transcriptional regulator
MVSFAARCRGGHKEALTCAEVATEQARALGDDELPSFIRALILNRLGNEAYELGDWSRAEAVLQEALGHWRRLGAGGRWQAGMVLGWLAVVAEARGDDARAAALYRESLQDFRWRKGDLELGAVGILTRLACLAVTNGQPEGAVRLFAVAEATQRRTGLILPSDNRANNDEALAAARDALGEEAFAAAWAAGWNIPLHRAVAEARDVAVDVGRAARAAAAPRPGAAAGDLTPRELEVLGLVAEGLTNAQVAEKLFLSPRTVNAHLTSVYHKLRVGSRSAAVRFAVEHDLV